MNHNLDKINKKGIKISNNSIIIDKINIYINHNLMMQNNNNNNINNYLLMKIMDNLKNE